MIDGGDTMNGSLWTVLLTSAEGAFIDPRRENPGIYSGDERRTNV
jgi:hypothetical protein